MSQPKKQNFLQGAALLALSVGIVKVIGAVYKIPLRAIIGDVGFAYFNTAYDIYSLLLTIATAGLPVAMSRMVSQAYSLGHYNKMRRIYQVARTIYLSLGLISSLIMGFFCRSLADWMGQPDAWTAVLCLAPCALLMGFLSSYRGFFQGQGNMAPTSFSQVLEAVCKLVVGLFAAFAIMRSTGSVSLAAGGAILGVTVSCVASAIYMHHKFRPAYAALENSAEAVDSFRATTGQLLRIAIPITIGSAGLQLLNVLEIGLYMDRLESLLAGGKYLGDLVPVLETEVKELADYTDAQKYSLMASSLKGVYNFSYTIFNMPCSIITPINTSLLPAITASVTLNKHTDVRATEESAARITGLLAVPCAVGLAVLAEPVMALLGGYTGEKLVLATQLMTVMSIAIVPYLAVMFTNSLLQSHNKTHIPVIHTLICGAAKLVTLVILTGNPAIGILGVPICALLCYLSIFILNLIALRMHAPEKPRLVSNLLRAVIPALIMGAAVYASLWALRTLAGITSSLILCAIPIVVGVIVYVIAAVLLKTITREDCLLLPQGEKIAKLLHL